MITQAKWVAGILAFAAAILTGGRGWGMPQDADPGAWPSGVQVADEPEGSATACDKNLLKAVSVNGIDPAYASKEKSSSPLIPSVGFATPDMAAAIDPTVADLINISGIPGMGIMKLVHDGELKLDDRPFPFAGAGQIIAGTPGNLFYAGQSSAGNPYYQNELTQITVNDLLHHAGGWNRDEAGAPDLTGYPVLQMLATFVTEKTGKPSGPPLKSDAFTPLGMTDTALGSAPGIDRQDRESIHYDTDPAQPPEPSLFPPRNVVSEPYSSIGAPESSASIHRASSAGSELRGINVGPVSATAKNRSILMVNRVPRF